MSLMYRLKSALTCPSLQDSREHQASGASLYPFLVAVFGCARHSLDFYDDSVANRTDSFSATPVGFRVCWPDNPDQFAVFPFAICFFLPADSPWLRNMPAPSLLGSEAECVCNRRIEMCLVSLSPPRFEECARRKIRKKRNYKGKNRRKYI